MAGTLRANNGSPEKNAGIKRQNKQKIIVLHFLKTYKNPSYGRVLFAGINKLHSIFIIHHLYFFMTIELSAAGKRFNRDWIFRKLSTSFRSGKAYAITGANGSGKSTLLQVLAANIVVNAGTIKWKQEVSFGLEEINENNVFQHIAVCAPYLEVIEEMTATEFLQFHSSFKPLLPHTEVSQIIEIVGLAKAANKQIRYYSSGMKQRIKLAQAIFSDVPVLLLDEPCTNLDTTGFDLYHQLIETYCKKKLIVVSSNDSNEYDFCTEQLHIGDYK